MDWTDLESFSRPPPHGTSDCADPEASWGHRKNNLLRSEDELFYGYYLSAGIMMRDENGPGRPRARPPRHGVVLPARPRPRLRPRPDRDARAGHPARRHPRRLRLLPPRRRRLGLPLRAAGAQLVQDLHPHDRGPKGTHQGAVISNGNLYCPQTPRPLLELGPLARTATREQAADHDRKTTELARYKLGRLTGDDQDGYHRVQCPAAMGKIRCPLRPASMTLDRDRPEILSPAAAPPGLLRAADHHRPARRRSPRPRRSTTTRPRPGAAPTPAAPAPSAASPPSRTPPPTTSPAAGAASRAWRP